MLAGTQFLLSLIITFAREKHGSTSWKKLKFKDKKISSVRQTWICKVLILKRPYIQKISIQTGKLKDNHKKHHDFLLYMKVIRSVTKIMYPQFIDFFMNNILEHFISEVKLSNSLGIGMV